MSGIKRVRIKMHCRVRNQRPCRVLDNHLDSKKRSIVRLKYSCFLSGMK